METPLALALALRRGRDDLGRPGIDLGRRGEEISTVRAGLVSSQMRSEVSVPSKWLQTVRAPP
jgi:hypothetical protein